MASGSVEPRKGFKSQKFSYTYGTVSSNSVLNITGSNLKYSIPSGYVPFSFTQYSTGSALAGVARIYPRNTGSSTVMTIRNRSDSGITGTCSLTVTFVPEEMVEDVSGKYSVEIAEASESFGKVVDPTTGLPTDQLFFTPEDTIAFLFDEHDDSDPALTLSSISLSYSNGTSGTITVDPTTFVNGKYFTTMTMPEKSIVATGNYT